MSVCLNDRGAYLAWACAWVMPCVVRKQKAWARLNRTVGHLLLALLEQKEQMNDHGVEGSCRLALRVDAWQALGSNTCLRDKFVGILPSSSRVATARYAPASLSSFRGP